MIDMEAMALRSRFESLERRLADTTNDISLIPSIQKAYLELEARLSKLEMRCNAMQELLEPSIKRLEALIHNPDVPPPPSPSPRGPRREWLEFTGLAELIDAIETNFTCLDGDYASFATATHDEAYRYRSLGFLMRGDNDERAFMFLRNALFSQLIDIKGASSEPLGKPLLFWRYNSTARINEEFDMITGLYKINTRVAVPTCDWSKVKVKQECESYEVIE